MAALADRQNSRSASNFNSCSELQYMGRSGCVRVSAHSNKLFYLQTNILFISASSCFTSASVTCYYYDLIIAAYSQLSNDKIFGSANEPSDLRISLVRTGGDH